LDRVREISKQEYDGQSSAVNANHSRLKVSYKVKPQAQKKTENCFTNIPHEYELKTVNKAITAIPVEGGVLYNPLHF